MRRFGRLLLIAYLVAAGGLCAQPKPQPQKPSAAAMAFSESSLSALQVEMRKALKEGKVSKDIVTCVRQLPASSFADTFEGLLREILDPAELRVADAFWSGTAGKKLARHEQLRFYTYLGQSLPEAIPQFSEREISEIQKFGRTSAGEKLMFEKALETQLVVRTILARRVALLASCESR